MAELVIDKLDVRQDEAILLAYHRNSGRWYASVGNLEQTYQRECVEVDSPTKALAELCLRIGGRIGRAG